MPEAPRQDQVVLAQELADRFAEVTKIAPRSSIGDFLRSHPEVLSAELLFNKVYREHPVELGKRVSRDERQTRNYNSPTLVYGEIDFIPFAEQFMKIKDKYQGLLTAGGTFMDVGTGTGRPVFAAALLHDFDRVVGIELLEGLSKVCREVHKLWEKELQPCLPEAKQRTTFDFLHTDATQHEEDWDKVDVVFANSTCFTDKLMDQLAMKADGMKAGAFFISTTRRLPSDCFEVLEQCKMSESWGEATVFIHRRVPEKVDL